MRETTIVRIRGKVFAAWWAENPIQKLRKKHGFSYLEMAREVIYKNQDSTERWKADKFKKIEQGRESPSGHMILAICARFGVSPTHLVNQLVEWNRKKPRQSDMYFLSDELWRESNPIRMRREALSLNKSRFMYITKIDRRVTERFEAGIHPPSLFQIMAYARVLGVSVGVLAEELSVWHYADPGKIAERINKDGELEEGDPANLKAKDTGKSGADLDWSKNNALWLNRCSKCKGNQALKGGIRLFDDVHDTCECDRKLPE